MNQVVRKYYILLRVADLCWDFGVLIILSVPGSSLFSNVEPLSRNTPERNLEGSDMRCKICIKQLQLWTSFSDRQTILLGKNNTAKKWIKTTVITGKKTQRQNKYIIKPAKNIHLRREPKCKLTFSIPHGRTDTYKSNLILRTLRDWNNSAQDDIYKSLTIQETRLYNLLEGDKDLRTQTPR